jgi:hemoglobin-like flavoprotein
MTKHQQELVQSSFKKLSPITQEAAELFYSRLFEIAPYLRPLFRNDLKEQGKKLMETLAVVVNGLDRFEDISPLLKKLGQQHTLYGVTNAHYDIAASALLWTLERGLGAEFTDEVRNAWVSFYGIVADTMKKGAEEVHHAA